MHLWGHPPFLRGTPFFEGDTHFFAKKCVSPLFLACPPCFLRFVSPRAPKHQRRRTVQRGGVYPPSLMLMGNAHHFLFTGDRGNQMGHCRTRHLWGFGALGEPIFQRPSARLMSGKRVTVTLFTSLPFGKRVTVTLFTSLPCGEGRSAPDQVRGDEGRVRASGCAARRAVSRTARSLPRPWRRRGPGCRGPGSRTR